MKTCHPLPAAGGSYLRNPDGSLTPIEVLQDEPALIEEAPAEEPEAVAPTPKPTVKRGGKAPAKEG